ncbi:hypothetical protein [Profundibacter sp.]|uniref:hypothetical protein n=1 Tax=Profundibacter sp. TaxID=3101071 RepID=UPI003D09D938
MSRFSAPQKTLLVATPLIVLVLIYLFPTLTHSLGKSRGLAIALAIYWGAVCFGFGLTIGNLCKFPFSPSSRRGGRFFACPA